MPGSDSPQVLIVAGPDDGIAIRLREALEAKGRNVAHLDGMAASRLFTIHVRSDRTTVEPTLPMFLRASGWWYNDAEADSDERFLRSEAYAAFWAVAALSNAFVINRPSGSGAVGRLTAAELSARIKANPLAQTNELYASGPDHIPEPNESLWGEDMNFLTAPITELKTGNPVRARALNPCSLYEIVTVVGDRAFPATTDSRTVDLDLAARSIEYVKELGLHFATVTWACDEQGAKPIRLNTAPDEQELRYAWAETSEALCEDLLT